MKIINQNLLWFCALDFAFRIFVFIFNQTHFSCFQINFLNWQNKIKNLCWYGQISGVIYSTIFTYVELKSVA